MKDLALRTMVVCAAISTFGVGALTIYRGADSLATEKVKTILVANRAEQAPKAAEDTIERTPGQ